jgi:hypothetical protein
MKITKSQLKQLIKEELDNVLNEYISGLGAASGLVGLKMLDRLVSTKGAVSGAMEDDLVQLGISGASLFASSPYIAAVLFIIGNAHGATKTWNALPKNHPLKIKHYEYLARARSAKKDERRRARIAKYGWDPKEEVFKKQALKDARDILASMLPKDKAEPDKLKPEDEESIEQWLKRTETN